MSIRSIESIPPLAPVEKAQGVSLPDFRTQTGKPRFSAVPSIQPLHMQRALPWILLITAVLGLSAFLYSRSDYRKLLLVDSIYAELEHPSWSERLKRDKCIYSNRGSGKFNMLYLVDVRHVSIPLSKATSFYEREGERLGFEEFHVDGYAEAASKFQQTWDHMKLQIPKGDDILILSQLFPAPDGNFRRHKALPP
jgi:hypothetical protein